MSKTIGPGELEKYVGNRAAILRQNENADIWVGMLEFSDNEKGDYSIITDDRPYRVRQSRVIQHGMKIGLVKDTRKRAQFYTFIDESD